MRRFLVLSSALVVISLTAFGWAALSQDVHAATLSVNTTADTDDGSCSPLAGGCTLREALNAANDNDTIAFNIPVASDPGCNAVSTVCRIVLTANLPALDGNGKTINGYTQPNASPNTLSIGNDAEIKIEILLSGMTGIFALPVTGDNMTVRGLAMFGQPSTPGVKAAIGLDGSSGSTIEGNFLGLVASGDDGFNGTGISYGVYFDTATNNTIGGTAPSDRNVISGLHTGLVIVLDSDDNDIAGNYFSTDPAGSTAIANDTSITIQNSNDVQIGEPSGVNGRNVISGGGEGIFVGQGSSVPGLKVQNNYIGLKAGGAQPLGNMIGIKVYGTGDILIGGAGAGNIISGNTTGVLIDQGAAMRIEGNRIGTNAAGTAAVANDVGVFMSESLSADIGGTTAAEANVISGNTTYGLQIDSGAQAVTVAGNIIGANLSGTSALPNGTGIFLDSASAVVIGGGQASARNIIAGNSNQGIYETEGSSDNVVQRNYIGTNLPGTVALPNQTGAELLGDDALVTLNVISGNTAAGLLMGGAGWAARGNLIGVGANGAALGNGGNGISVLSGSFGAIENVPSGPPNLIAHNGGDGIRLQPGAPNSVVDISRNSIFLNVGLGIDLGSDGVTPNDPDDPDSGPNGLLNWPLLTLAYAGTTTVTGSLDTLPNRPYRLEIFVSDTCDPSGNGEGAVYAGAAVIPTDADGQIDFVVQSLATAPVGSIVTATVTDLTPQPASGPPTPQGTSEFSNCATVQTPPTPAPSPTGATPTPTPTIVPIDTPPPSGAVTDEPTATPTPTPTATPTATPGATTPTPTRNPDRRQGDIDCSGTVTGRDSLILFLFESQFTTQGFQPCPSTASDVDGAPWGDVDCDGDVDLDDAIDILWWLAGYDPNHQEPCTHIGELFPV